MENKNFEVLKLCSFYVSDWHIVTMLLPYINTKIDQNVKVIPIFEKDIKNNIEILVNKLNLKNKEKILNIDWKNEKGIKYTDVNNIIKENKEKEILFIVNGNINYMDIVNKNIEKSLSKNNIKNKITTINCYEVIEFNNNIQEILDKHDKILNTSGEKEIEEIFEGYEKKKLK